MTDVLQVIDKAGKRVSIRIGGSPVFTSPNPFSTPVGTPATALVIDNMLKTRICGHPSAGSPLRLCERRRNIL